MEQQLPITSFFPSRKRASPEELKIKGNKVLVLDVGDGSKGPASVQLICDTEITNVERNASAKDNKVKLQSDRKKQLKAAIQKKLKDGKNQPALQDLFSKMVKKGDSMEMDVNPEEHLKTPPASPTKKVNLMDNLKEPTLKDIKDKINKSSRLAELKASMARFKQGQDKLDKMPEAKRIRSEISSKKAEIANTLNARKESVAKKSLFKPRSSENLVDQKTSFTIPYNYRVLAEIFRGIDTVCQIMHNRKETITFRHLKPALEELLKKNVKLSHLAQLKTLYPEAYNYRQEKIRSFGTGVNQEKWELVIVPNIEETMTSQVLLERRRNLYNIIIEKLQVLHAQFLLTLSPPIVIVKENLKRWHPQFEIEKVADVELAELPEPPYEEKLSTGKEVLEKVKAMFNCNTRMESALEKLKKAQEAADVEKPKALTSVLKGIPKALLEKVRQKQAAKALESMTRCDATEKELQMYARLPEMVKFTRNIFVGEKKSVLPVDTVVDKLVNSMRTYMHKHEIEKHLRIIAKEVPTWMVFHTVRNGVFIKILKDANILRVCDILAEVLKKKRTAKAL